MTSARKEGSVTIQKAIDAAAAAKVENFDEIFEEYLAKIFYRKPNDLSNTQDESVIEVFGILSLNNCERPNRKLWYLYFCKKPDLNETLDGIRAKYGKKNMYEIFQKSMFSGAGLMATVKKHFRELKWRAKGNLLEAPPESHYTDERLIKTVTDLYNDEQRKLYNFLSVKHHWYFLYNKP